MNSSTGGQLNSMPYVPNLKLQKVYLLLPVTAHQLQVHKNMSLRRDMLQFGMTNFYCSLEQWE